ncbi:hypothetical protein [Blastococcus brunescens]|uniref:Uncharacterized protein n=1 Tax=Blastococcus brunescens TaxID=1564165 RepID=A0ABZ1B4G9_9ACTN|nr:hypothetical protein [Blastococcus sp. BMG 8361]WRL65690.1 hypothetical protein U6N30_08965 [Blastococcus sp. BMG 8361]
MLAAFAAGLGVLALPAVAEQLKAVLDAEGNRPRGWGSCCSPGRSRWWPWG